MRSLKNSRTGSATSGVTTALSELMTIATYSSTGFSLRRRGWDPTSLDVNLEGKVCLVTGGSMGLGFGIARALARLGATTVIGCRNQERGKAAAASIRGEIGNNRVLVEAVDIASIASVRSLAERFGSSYGRLDILVNNAGASFGTRERTVDGLELTFATNVLGGFHLTARLSKLLAATGNARVIHIGSAAQFFHPLDVDKLLSPSWPYLREARYAAAKRAVADLNDKWAERLGPLGITSNCMHPGVMATPGVMGAFPRYHRLLRPLLRSLDQGADTAVWLAASVEAGRHTGKSWFDREARPSHAVPWTRAAPSEVARLWSVCASLCGLEDETIIDVARSA